MSLLYTERGLQLSKHAVYQSRDANQYSEASAAFADLRR
jgi:hypothetical protein